MVSSNSGRFPLHSFCIPSWDISHLIMLSSLAPTGIKLSVWDQITKATKAM